MPFHLTRRRFIVGTVAAGVGLLVRTEAGAADSDPHRWALLSDPHVAADPAKVNLGVNMTDHLRSVVAEVLARPTRPAGVLLNGDCAFKSGEPEDYTSVVGLLKPLSEGGLPVHATLGNHDHREHFRAGFHRAGAELVEGRCASIVESPRANWLILDSLDQTNVTPGRLEEPQRRWLAEALDARKERPALVMVHHNPLFTTPGKMAGLLDWEELFQILAPRKQVKALFYGHVHKWEYQQRDGLHVLGLPPVSYPFTAGDPTGWAEARLETHGAKVELRCLDVNHPSHGQVRDLEWRPDA